MFPPSSKLVEISDILVGRFWGQPSSVNLITHIKNSIPAPDALDSENSGMLGAE